MGGSFGVTEESTATGRGAEGKAERFQNRGQVPTSTHQPEKLVCSPASAGGGWGLRLGFVGQIPGRGLGLAAKAQPEGGKCTTASGRESGKNSGPA